MKNLKKSHWLLIILSILILAGTIGITAYMLFSNYQNVRLFKQAQNNFKRGDEQSINVAEAQLLQLIRSDSDNESAYLMLGEIAEMRKVYPEQVYYCYMAHRLNPLSEENKKLYIKSLWFARYFDRLENFLSQQDDLSDKQKQIMLYAAGRNRNFDKYKHKIPPHSTGNSVGELALLLFRDKKLTAEEKIAALDKIKQDDFIKQEIFAARAELYLETGNIDKTEQALKSAYELNSYAFAPALGRFYANFRSLKLALSIFEKHLATYHDPAIALQTAEIYCLLKKKDEITKLRNQYQGDSGNQAMLLCYYFDAMNALINDDMALLKELLVPLRKNLSTPLALFMFFCADIQEKNLSAILESYTTLITRRGYADLKLRADDILSAFLKKNLTSVSAGEEQLLALAKLLYNRKHEVFTAKVILLIQKKSGSLNLVLLKDALKRFPQDQGIIKIAIEYYIGRDSAECEKQIAAYKKKFPAKASDMLRYEITLAAMKKDFNRVSALFRKNFFPAIRREYWNFAGSTKRESDLIFLSQDKLYAPFCQALLLIMKGDVNAACDLLEKADAQGEQELLFFAAKTLAENGRNHSALRKYRQFPENSPYKLDILLNTAELYAEIGNTAQALNLSRKAYQLAPGRQETQLCYADKLYRSSNLAAIPDVIKLKSGSPLRKRMERLWIYGMQQRIKECNLHSQRERARELCRQLLSVSPDNEIALECMEKLKKMKQ